MNKQQLRQLIQEEISNTLIETELQSLIHKEIKRALREYRPDMTDDDTPFSNVFKDSDSKAVTMTYAQGKDVTFVLTKSTEPLDKVKLENNEEIKKAIGIEAINLIIQKIENKEMDNAINHTKSANKSSVLIITSPDIQQPYVNIK